MTKILVKKKEKWTWIYLIKNQCSLDQSSEKTVSLADSRNKWIFFFLPCSCKNVLAFIFALDSHYKLTPSLFSQIRSCFHHSNMTYMVRVHVQASLSVQNLLLFTFVFNKVAAQGQIIRQWAPVHRQVKGLSPCYIGNKYPYLSIINSLILKNSVLSGQCGLIRFDWEQTGHNSSCFYINVAIHKKKIGYLSPNEP